MKAEVAEAAAAPRGYGRPNGDAERGVDGEEEGADPAAENWRRGESGDVTSSVAGGAPEIAGGGDTWSGVADGMLGTGNGVDAVKGDRGEKGSRAQGFTRWTGRGIEESSGDEEGVCIMVGAKQSGAEQRTAVHESIAPCPTTWHPEPAAWHPAPTAQHPGPTSRQRSRRRSLHPLRLRTHALAPAVITRCSHPPTRKNLRIPNRRRHLLAHRCHRPAPYTTHSIPDWRTKGLAVGEAYRETRGPP